MKLASLVLILCEPSLAATYRHASDGTLLPDPVATPGIVATTDARAVCAGGYSATMRKRVRSSTLKHAVAAYGVHWNSRKYQADHLISLELGGAPDNQKNIWPQPVAQAHAKDRREYFYRKQVCSGKMSLADAQKQIVHWKK